MNPARSDQSPRAADLWGDQRATGFLVRFVNGFASPPHTHNAAPDAAYQWMGPGWFWVQPAGGDHITAARGADGLAYIEIGSRPYLVRPSDQAFRSDDAAQNVPAADLPWERHDRGVQRAALWGPTDGAGPAASSAAAVRRGGPWSSPVA